MNDTLATALMLGIFGISAAMVVRAFRTGRISLGSGLEADRRDAKPTWWFLVALWSVSAVAALALAVTRLAA
jgi:hypothetical protein